MVSLVCIDISDQNYDDIRVTASYFEYHWQCMTREFITDYPDSWDETEVEGIRETGEGVRAWVVRVFWEWGSSL